MFLQMYMTSGHDIWAQLYNQFYLVSKTHTIVESVQGSTLFVLSSTAHALTAVMFTM